MFLFFVAIQMLWFFLPAAMANIAPVLAARYNWLPTLNKPVDGGATFKGRPVLGENKTIRGFIVGVIFGSITAIFQYFLVVGNQMSSDILLMPYDNIVIVAVIGAVMGFGALLGDATKSFFKRQINRPPGKPWWPFDQIDFVIGAIMVTWKIVPLTLLQITTALIVIGLGSFVVSYVGRALKIKKSL